jgi:nicotinate-nucleotide adenylyltransferase
MKVGIFGGTFNPIHYGHLRAAEEVKEKAILDKILFIPSGRPPLKSRDIADARHRYEMTRLALMKNTHFELSDRECRQKGKSYTIKTLKELKRSHPERDFYFILGIDAFLDMPNWWHHEELLTLAHFIIISRPGFQFIDLRMAPAFEAKKSVLRKLDNKENELYTLNLQGPITLMLLRLTPVGISSTEIRSRIKQDRSIKYLLPASVESYIIANKLYRKEQRVRVKR